MMGSRPDFLDSPFFVMEEDNWHLLPGAPEEVVKEFNEYMKDINKVEEPEWVWALVGNVKEEREYGENHEIKKGTKQFSGGTKVYLSCSHWGDGYEQVNVIGKPRHSWDYIQIIMPRKFIENFRMQKIYKPAVLAKMKSDKGWGGFWDNTQKSRLDIMGYLHFLAPDEFEKEKEKVLIDGIMYSDVKDYCLKYCENKYSAKIDDLEAFLTDERLIDLAKNINKRFSTNINTDPKFYRNLDIICTHIIERQFRYDDYYFYQDFYDIYEKILKEGNKKKEPTKFKKLSRKEKKKRKKRRK